MLFYNIFLPGMRICNSHLRQIIIVFCLIMVKIGRIALILLPITYSAFFRDGPISKSGCNHTSERDISIGTPGRETKSLLVQSTLIFTAIRYPIRRLSRQCCNNLQKFITALYQIPDTRKNGAAYHTILCKMSYFLRTWQEKNDNRKESKKPPDQLRGSRSGPYILANTWRGSRSSPYILADTWRGSRSGPYIFANTC